MLQSDPRPAERLEVDPDGLPPGLRRHLDRQAGGQRALLDHLEATGLDGVWFLDLAAPQVPWISRGFWRLLGHDAPPPQNAGWRSLCQAADAEHVAKSLAALRADPANRLDLVIRCSDRYGSAVWIRLRGVALRDQASPVVHALGTFTDVTQLHRTRHQLDGRGRDLADQTAAAEEARTTLRVAETLAGIGHWRIDLADRSLSWSDPIYEIHGVARDTYVPTIQTALAFYHPEDRQAVLDAVEGAIQDESAFTVRLRILRGDGALRNVELSGQAMRGADGKPLAVFGVFVDLTERCPNEQALREANARLQALVHVDALTGIANRRRFDEALERDWRAAGRRRTALSVVLIDIDRFKQYNDVYGHQAGDEALRAVATALNAIAMRPADLVARYGGEELVMLLPETEPEGAAAVAEHARQAVEALRLAHPGNQRCGGVLTITLGIATAWPGREQGPQTQASLVAMADRLLYEGKRFGRNRVVSLVTLREPVASANDGGSWLDALSPAAAIEARRRRPELDGIARVAARMLDTPIALVSLIGRHDVRFGGNFGFESEEGMSNDVSFCAHAVLSDEPMVVSDATTDPRFETNPLVTGENGIRFYAGAPIISERTGHCLGAVCVIDQKPRDDMRLAQRAVLADLAMTAGRLIDEDCARGEEDQRG